MKTKQYLDTLIVLWTKWNGIVEIKHRLYKRCFNYVLSNLIVDNGLEDPWRRRAQISLSSPATIDLPVQDLT